VISNVSISSTRDRSRATGAFFALAAILIVWVVYRPDRVRPLDMLDFGEFVPLVKAAQGWWAQLAAVVDYNLTQHGRVNIVQVIAAVLKWRVFGDWTPGWQLAQAATMGAVIVQAFILLRRLGASAFGAAVGASIFLFAPAAARRWIRVTMAEPVGMIAVLGLALRATGYQQRTRWLPDVWWFAVGTLFVLQTKELMAPALLIPLTLALTMQAEGSLSLPRWNRRNVILVVVVGVATIGTLIPLAFIYLNASSNAFASQYGSGSQSLGGLIVIWLSTLVPFVVVPERSSVMWAGALAGYIGIVASGWWIASNNPMHRSYAPQLFAASIAIPVLGALSYAPWPMYEERYSFPYLLGACVLLGLSASFIQREVPRGLLAGAGAWLFVFAFGLSNAAAQASRADAAQRAVDSVVNTVATQSGLDSVLVGTKVESKPAWIGIGPTLFRLAEATDRPWQPTREVRCAEVESLRESRSRLAIVAFASSCGHIGSPTRSLSERYRFIDWTTWRVRSDSVQAYFILAGANTSNGVQP
jgi:hypothetical protein